MRAKKALPTHKNKNNLKFLRSRRTKQWTTHMTFATLIIKTDYGGGKQGVGEKPTSSKKTLFKLLSPRGAPLMVRYHSPFGPLKKRETQHWAHISSPSPFTATWIANKPNKRVVNLPRPLTIYQVTQAFMFGQYMRYVDQLTVALLGSAVCGNPRSLIAGLAIYYFSQIVTFLCFPYSINGQ